MDFDINVRYQNGSGQFFCLVLFSLYSGKHYDVIYNYDGIVLFKKIEDRRKSILYKHLNGWSLDAPCYSIRCYRITLSKINVN